MNETHAKVRDPVCLMWVAPDEHALEYQDLHYAFCSEQCRQRFQANPELYVSATGYHAAAKQQGRQLRRKRRWLLATAPMNAQAEEAHAALAAMMGVNGVCVTGNAVEVDYDLMQATAEQIEHCIEGHGLRLSASVWDRLRRAWVHYVEDTQVANLASGASHSGHHH